MNEPMMITEPRTIDTDPRRRLISSLPVDTLPVLALGLWFIAQFGLFYQYVEREILWAFPGAWDQVRFLQESRDTYQYIVHNGLLRGLVHAVTTPTPTGNLLCTEAAILYLFLGGSRLTALLVLFVHWIVLQAVVIATIRWLSGRWSVVVIALALLLLAASPFQAAGGLTDFRIDFAAYCAFGVFLCLAIRSNVFANRPWGMLAGLVASYLILLRFITLVYLGVIGAMFFVAGATLWLFRRRPATVRDRDRMRLINLLLVGGLILAICLPVFWHNWDAIQRYYIVSHATGEDKYIRAREFGVNSRLDSILYYPRSVREENAGPLFCKAAVGLVLVSLLLAGLRRKYSTMASSTPVSERLDAVTAYAFLFCCLLGPYLVLTADVSKSPVVGNIFVPPLWALVMLSVIYVTESLRTSQWLRHASTILAVMIFSVALNYQVSSYNKPGRFTEAREDVRQVLELHDLIGQKCQELGLQTPSIATDVLRDGFFPGVVGVTQWERHQMVIFPRPAFTQAVTAPDEADVMAGLHSADFALLSLSDGAADSPYPFDHVLQALRPKLLELCDREMLPLRETSFFDQRVRLYMRPSVRMETRYPDWITEDGFTLRGMAAALRRFPRITLRGSTFAGFHFPRDDGNLTATLEMENLPSLPVPATLTETNGQYTIQLLVPTPKPSGDNPLTIRVRFHRYVVPKDLGVNDDWRHLVVRLPDSVHLDRPTAD